MKAVRLEHRDGGLSTAGRWIRRLSIPILLFWLATAALLNVCAPQLEQVEKLDAISLSPPDGMSVKALRRIGQIFKESDSDATAMVVLESTQPLDAKSHQYYDALIKRLSTDDHVEHIQNFWGDPLTESGAQSKDGRAAYVQLNLAGNIGEGLANESVERVRRIVADAPWPTGVTVFVTGITALNADLTIAGDRSMLKITAVTSAVIFLLLWIFYRSVATVLLLMSMVNIGLLTGRGAVAVLGYHHVIDLTTFAVNLVVSLAIAAGTDYGIFLIGRYQEARLAGADREAAYDQMFNGAAHVIFASGLTIAGATYCLSFTRMPYFETLAVPCAVAMLAAVAIALTLGPSLVYIGSRFGLLEPKRAMRIRLWRRTGTAIVRWPVPVLVASLSIAIIGLAALPGYRANYDDRHYIPASIPANVGFQAAGRHFSNARMNPDMLIIESDHDMRNPADFLVIDKVAKAVFRVSGVARVQTITRPQGTPIEHSSIPFLISMQSVGPQQKIASQEMVDFGSGVVHAFAINESC